MDLDAFKNLRKLKWISLESSEIETIEENMFENKTALEYINLGRNYIVQINRNLFKNLKNLKMLILEENFCVDKNFHCFNCSINTEDLETELQECFVERKTKKCEYAGPESYVLWPEFKHCYVNSIVELLESEKYIFSFHDPYVRRSEVTAVQFMGTKKVTFIPPDVLMQFKSLNGLIIEYSITSVIKANLLSVEFRKIEHLKLSSNLIQHFSTLEEFAVAQLKLQ